jgi:hypothetical protein
MAQDKIYIEYQGVNVWYTLVQRTEKIDAVRRRMHKRSDICPICKEVVQAPQFAYLIINNYKLFPNVAAHQDCVDQMGQINTAAFLTNDYHKALEFKHWF